MATRHPTNIKSKMLFAILVSGLAALLEMGCSMQPALEPEAPAPEPAKGVLVVSFIDNASRTIAPTISMTPASYEISGTGSNSDTFTTTSLGSSVTIPNLSAGTWTVTTVAKNAQGKSIGLGTGVTTVTGGATVTLDISVKPYTGPGTLDLTIDWTPGAVINPSAIVELINAGNVHIPLTAAIGVNKATVDDQVEAGYYTLSVNLLDGSESVASAVDIVRIVAGETSSGTVSFPDLMVPSGGVDIEVSPSLSDPLTVTIGNVSSSVASGTAITLTASSDANASNVSYSWFLNGSSAGSGAALPLNGSASPLTAGSYRVDVTAMTLDGARAGSATATFTVTAAAPSTYAGPPSESQVGPRVALTSRTGGSLPAGTYEGYRFTTSVSLQNNTGAYVFRDCSFDAGFGVFDGRSGVSRTVLLDHTYVFGGIYFEYGGQTNWTVKWTRIVGDRKAFRPTGLTGQQDTTSPTPCVVEDSIFSITLLGTPSNHVDTLQALGGNGMTFTRVRFTTPGPYEAGVTGQTSAVNVNAGNTLLDSCEFLEKGAFYYTVYSNAANVRFKDCRIIGGLAGYVYPSNPNKAAFENCVDYETGALIQQ